MPYKYKPKEIQNKKRLVYRLCEYYYKYKECRRSIKGYLENSKYEEYSIEHLKREVER